MLLKPPTAGTLFDPVLRYDIHPRLLHGSIHRDNTMMRWITAGVVPSVLLVWFASLLDTCDQTSDSLVPRRSMARLQLVPTSAGTRSVGQCSMHALERHTHVYTKNERVKILLLHSLVVVFVRY